MAGSKRGKGTGKPSEKDRAAHEAARGRKLPTLAELSSAAPTEEEVGQLIALMESESDRGSALVAGSFLETAVEFACTCRMVDEKAILKAVFDDPNGPGKSFSGKIKLALALGRFGPITAERLTLAKDIRNAFAHALRPLDFMHPTIAKACDTLASEPFFKDVPAIVGPRARYLAFCRLLFKELYQEAQRDGDAELTYKLP